MKKTYISVLNFISMRTQILCAKETELRETETRSEEEALDKFLTKHGADISNSNYMQTEKFPLYLEDSELGVLEALHIKLRDELIRRILHRYTLNPDSILEFCTWDESTNASKLFYDKEEGFNYDGQYVSLSDFCTEDLMYILEQVS
jgi:hypothetical protein